MQQSFGGPQLPCSFQSKPSSYRGRGGGLGLQGFACSRCLINSCDFGRKVGEVRLLCHGGWAGQGRRGALERYLEDV